ncbi:transposable element Tcb2 transposase [Trichonephila clavipes]|nr:transposable element Tcb2 transposase [Trichonephila clavipes]
MKEVSWRIVVGLEAGQFQVQICREFNLTPSFVCNLSEQLQNTGSIERKPGERWSKSHDGQRRSPFVDYSEMVIWRELWTHYLPSNVHEIDNYGGGELIV